MQKARRHPTKGLRPLVSVWFQDLFHSVIHGSFHLSLTVLVHYRSLRSIQPYRMVPADSHRVPLAPRYSGYRVKYIQLRVRDYHPLWSNFPISSTHQTYHHYGPTTPTQPKLHRFGLFPFRSPLLRKSLLFSLPLLTQMFQFGRFAIISFIKMNRLPHSEIYD